MIGKTTLLIGELRRVREFENALASAGVTAVVVPDDKKALEILPTLDLDAIVFIVPVYWQSVSEFVETIRQDSRWARLPIVYLGDFIEASDQVILKRQGVHTLTLGPVPPAEAVRFILKLISN